MSLPLLPHGPWPEPLEGTPQIWGDVSIVITRWDGTLYRWAGDELDAAYIPCDLVYTTSMPGGFKSATCTLFRAMLGPTPEGLFDAVVIIGPGGQVYWEGRLQAMPASTADGGRISPAAVGHSAALEDRQDVQAVWVDRELANWRPNTATRKLALRGIPYALADATVTTDDASASAGPVLEMIRETGSPTWASASARPMIGIAYDAAGATITGMEFRCRGVQDVASWRLESSSWSDTAGSVSLLEWQLLTITEGARRQVTFAAGARNNQLAMFYPTAPAGNPASRYGLTLAEVAVYGDLANVRTGRTDSLTWGAGEGPLGVYADSVIRDAVGRWAPSIRTDDESVQQTSHLIPHLAQRDLGTVASLIEQVNRSHWWDWAVWEDRRLWYHERYGGQSRTWLVATDDGAVLDMEGETTDVVWTGVVVSYTDFGGTTHTIGPAGSTAETIDERLQTTDPDNRALLHGIPKIGHYQLSAPVDLEGAVFCGVAWLDSQSQATRRGSCTVTGTVLDDAGNEHPIDMVRAGDRLQVIDRPDDPDRRIIETSVTHASRTNQLTLDNTAQSLEALLERMESSYVGVL